MSQSSDSPTMGRTSIQVSDELADELHSRKARGESYEDVVWRLIDADDNDAACSDLERALENREWGAVEDAATRLGCEFHD